MKKLSLFKVINDYQSVNGNVGTLLIMNEIQEDGEFKGQQIKSWNVDPKFVPEDTGYVMDTEGRISPELVTKRVMRDQAIEKKFELAALHGVEVHI